MDHTARYEPPLPPAPPGGVERCKAEVGRLRFDISSGFEQHADDFAIVAIRLLKLRGNTVKGCVAIITCPDATSVPQKCSHNIYMALLCRHTKRIAVALTNFEFYASNQELFQRLEAIVTRGHVE